MVITVPVDVATLAAFPRQLRSKDRGPVWQFQTGPRELYRVNDSAAHSQQGTSR